MMQQLTFAIPWHDVDWALEIELDDDVVTGINFVSVKAQLSSEPGHPVLKQLADYFQNPASGFRLQLRPQGTPFQQRVWQQLQRIPSGQVSSYGEIARQLQTSPRAVGMACRANPIPLIIPCHRVVAHNHLGGYAGHTQGDVWQRKLSLLQHENALL